MGSSDPYFKLDCHGKRRKNMGDDVITAVWNILKGSLRVEAAAPVNVLVGSTTADSVSQGPASVTEYYDQTSGVFGETITDLAITASWMYDGTSIAGFRVSCTDGFVSMGSSVDISIQAGPSHIDDSGVAHLPYQIIVSFNNVTGGSSQTTISAEASGDGGGRSLAAPA
jgi:hypothetical protein